MPTLAALLIVAPSLSGSWSLGFLPVLLALAGLMCAEVIFGYYRYVNVSALAIGLLFLGGFTAAQNLPLGTALSFFSPQAAFLREFVDPDGPMTISYEPSATYREAAKLFLYVVVLMAASARTKKSGARDILRLVVISATVSVLAAALHRAAGMEKLWGCLPGERPAFELGTTLQNPNHTAGLCVLAVWSSLGLSFSSRRRKSKLLYLAATLVIVSAMSVEPSKGGILTLFVSLLVFLLHYIKYHHMRSYIYMALILFPTGLLGALVYVYTRYDYGYVEIFRMLSFYEKWEGIASAWEMVQSHYLVGIGRGAYTSLYSHYQVSNRQLTYVFPENIVAQLVSEWGMVVGLAALIGVCWMLINRCLSVKRIERRCALLGVGSLFFQNLFDFSLEMPGVAVLAVALCAATLPSKKRKSISHRRVDIYSPSLVWVKKVDSLLGTLIDRFMVRRRLAHGVMLTSLVLGCVASWCADRSGDLTSDLRFLKVHSAQILSGQELDEEKVVSLAKRHPANVLVVSQIAYLYGIDRPPDLRSALKYANRALYFGPKYAEVYVLTARILISLSVRDQAFRMLRTAWSLASDRTSIVDTVVSSKANTHELIVLIPREDATSDEIKLSDLAELALKLAQRKEMGLAQRLLSKFKDKGSPDQPTVLALQRASFVSEVPEFASSFGENWLVRYPEDFQVRLLTARAALAVSDFQTLGHHLDVLDRYIIAADMRTVDIQRKVLDMRLSYLIAMRSWAEAHLALTQLSHILPMTADTQTSLALRRAEVFLASGDLHLALEPLSHARQWSPADLDIRLKRAKVLDRLQRRPEAVEELRAILRRDSKHSVAQVLLLRWQGSH